MTHHTYVYSEKCISRGASDMRVKELGSTNNRHSRRIMKKKKLRMTWLCSLIVVAVLSFILGRFTMVFAYDEENLAYVDQNYESQVKADQNLEEYPSKKEDRVMDFIDAQDHWKLILVNRDHPIPQDYQMTLHYVEGAFLFDARATDALRSMLQSMRSAGLSPQIISTHRGYGHQTQVFNNHRNNLMRQGKSYEEATLETSRLIAVPGTSEHHLGLAVDILSASHPNFGASFSETAEGIWLASYSYRYGFILRYPRDTEEITGITFEPWHFRYVGYEAARYITEQGITLEEFHERYGRCIITTYAIETPHEL